MVRILVVRILAVRVIVVLVVRILDTDPCGTAYNSLNYEPLLIPMFVEFLDAHRSPEKLMSNPFNFEPPTYAEVCEV